MPAFAQGLAAGVKAMAKSITRTAGPHLKGMNPPRWVTGFVLFFLLVAVVILILAFAHTWALPRIEGEASRCFVDFAHSKSPMWLGCVMATHEVLAGGLIAAAGALFGAWLAFSGLKEQIALEQENTRILQRAYISVEPLGIEPFYSAAGVPDNVIGHVECRNVGHLPARDFQQTKFRQMLTLNHLNKLYQFKGRCMSEVRALPPMICYRLKIERVIY